MRLISLVLLGALAACTAEQPAPPKFENTDPCTLLRSGDVDGQQISGTPARAEQSCRYDFGGVEVRVTLRTDPYDQAANPLLETGGYGAVVEDHPMTRRCDDVTGWVTCEAVVEVADRKVVGLKVVKDEKDPNKVGQLTQGVALKVLERLPVTS